MSNILVAGAGKSSIYLIHYLLTHAPRNKWIVTVADSDLSLVRSKTGNHPRARAVKADITDPVRRRELVANADIVLSLVPPHLHILLAKDCLDLGKHFMTASYTTPELLEMDNAVRKKGLVFLCEMGLDPGIDHMTASNIITGIKRIAGTVTSFKSYCGGLPAPESDTNPWHYKISWNPRNVVNAGKHGAHYLQDNKQVTVPYEELFANNKRVQVETLEGLAYYANRDSMQYRNLLEVDNAATFLRATLRHPDFCKGWNAVIMLGLTDEDDIADRTGQTYYDWIAGKMNYEEGSSSLERVINDRLGISAQKGKVIQMLGWLGIFDQKPTPEGPASSADLLMSLLIQKWQMEPEDKDMVVMKHEVEYIHRGVANTMSSTMILKGEDRDFSAMSKTVGLPMAIAARLLLTGKVSLPAGIHIPTMPALYRPVLTELAHHGIVFHDEIS